jgi:hypothetical protein
MNDKNDKMENDLETQGEDIPNESESPIDEWQSELPPEDDFRDQQEYAEGIEDDLVDEAVAASAYEDGTSTDAPKRGKGILIGAVLVGVVFLGGLSYLQFGIGKSGGEGSALLPVSSVLNVRDLKKAPPEQPKLSDAGATVAEAVTQTTSKVDLDQIFDAGRAKTSGGATALPNGQMPEVIAEKPMEAMTTDVLASREAPLETTSGVSQPSASREQQANAQDQDKPKEENKPKVMSIPSMENPPQIAKIEEIPVIKPDQAKEKEAEETEQRLKALNEQVAKLEKSLEEATKKNEELLAKVETLSKDRPAAEAPAADVLPPPSALDLSSIDQGVVVPEAVKAEAAKKAPVKKVVKKASTSKPKAKKKASKKEPSYMVLRAATPNAAWVAPDANSNELRRVTVGETLPVIGQVKEIRQNAGVWEIVGTSGTLK